MSRAHRALSSRWRAGLEAIASQHGVSLRYLLQGRCRAYAKARADCYRYLKGEGWSYPQIGGLFGRDHTTIHYWLNEATRERCRANAEMVNERRKAEKGASHEPHSSQGR